MQGRVIGAAGPLHPCIPCIELYYQRYSHHFHSSEGLTSSFLLLDLLAGAGPSRRARSGGRSADVYSILRLSSSRVSGPYVSAYP